MVSGKVSHIHVRNAAFYVNISAVTFDTATSLDQETDLVAAGNIFKVKNLTITPPKGDVELVNFWGSDSQSIGAGVQGAGTFQHQLFDEKSWTEGRVTGTMVFSHDELGSTTPAGNSLEVLFYGNGIDIPDSPAFTRYIAGDLATSNQQRIKVGNLGFIWNNGAGIVNCVMSNVTVTALGDVKMTGVDGHWEQDFEAVCLHNDFSIERED